MPIAPHILTSESCLYMTKRENKFSKASANKQGPNYGASTSLRCNYRSRINRHLHYKLHRHPVPCKHRYQSHRHHLPSKQCYQLHRHRRQRPWPAHKRQRMPEPTTYPVYQPLLPTCTPRQASPSSPHGSPPLNGARTPHGPVSPWALSHGIARTHLRQQRDTWPNRDSTFGQPNLRNFAQQQPRNTMPWNCTKSNSITSLPTILDNFNLAPAVEINPYGSTAHCHQRHPGTTIHLQTRRPSNTRLPGNL
jgi:hypothetical protein